MSAEHLTHHPQDDPHGRGDYVAGIGVTRPGDGRSGGMVRAAQPVSISQPGRLQIRLVDPATQATSAGCGGLTGVTPLTLYRDWLVQTARAWDATL